MKSKLFILSMLSMFLMTSCATILTGTTDSIRFDSNPQGAKVYIDGLEVCKTPCTVEVKRNLSEKLVKMRLDGYETSVITLDTEFNGLSILNFFNVLGWGIDAATGSIKKYVKKGHDIKLEKDTKTSLLQSP